MQPDLFPHNNKQNFTQAAHLSFLVWVCSLHFALRVAGFLINIVRYTNEIFDGEPEYFGLCENMNVYQECLHTKIKGFINVTRGKLIKNNENLSRESLINWHICNDTQHKNLEIKSIN